MLAFIQFDGAKLNRVGFHYYSECDTAIEIVRTTFSFSFSLLFLCDFFSSRIY